MIRMRRVTHKMTIGLLDINMVQPVNLLHPLNRGLVVWYLALAQNTGGAEVMDIMSPGPNGLHGTLQSGVMNPVTDWVATNRPGGIRALTFDRAANVDNVQVLGTNSGTSRVDFGTGDLACTAWVKVGTSLGYICAKGNSFGAQSGFRVGVTGGAFILAAIGDGAQVSEESGIAPVADEWQFVGVSFDRDANFTFFVNQQIEVGADISAISGSINVAVSLFLGALQAGFAVSLDGDFDDLRLYNRTISHGEFLRLYGLSQKGYPGLLNRLP